MRIQKVHISMIKQGDTVVGNDGIYRTVPDHHIKKGFCGLSLFGDSYKCGTEKVKRVLY